MTKETLKKEPSNKPESAEFKITVDVMSAMVEQINRFCIGHPSLEVRAWRKIKKALREEIKQKM